MKKSHKGYTRRILASLLVVLLMCLLSITALALPEPTTRTVGASGDYATIQEAVDDAATGDTILVEAGTYTESVLVDKANLTIRSAAGAATTIVEGVSGSDVFYIDQPGVTIDGFTISVDAARGISFAFGATSASAKNNIISPKESSICTDAVYVNELSEGTLTVSGNTILDCGYGVYADENLASGTVLIDKNTISDCSTAIYLDDYVGDTAPVTVTISDNTITECSEGIYLYDVVDGSVYILNNDISLFDEEGIEIDSLGNGSIQITSNTLTDGYDGIYMSGSYYGDRYEESSANITITDNEFLRCSNYGLYFYGIEKGTLLVSRNEAIDCYYGLCVEEMGEYYVIDAEISYNTVSASGDTLSWDLDTGIEICCPNQETYVSFNTVSGYEYGLEIEYFGCCGVKPVLVTINNNEAFECDYGFYMDYIPETMPGTVNILNNWAHDNDSYGMWLDNIGYYGDGMSEINIKGNVFTNNPTGLFVNSIDEAYATVNLNYNGFVNNDGSYVTNDDFSGLDVTANWWATADGPTEQASNIGDIDKTSAGPTVYTPWVTSLAFDESSLSLAISATSQLALIADLSDDTTEDVTEYVFSYTSSNEDVAAVSPTGLVTAVGTGTAVITADCMGYDPAPEISVTVGTPYYPAYYTINATASAGGSISPSGAVTIVEYSGKAYTIAPNTGYEIGDVLVDGVSVGKVTEYTFSGIHANHTIEAKFVTHESVCGATKFGDVDASLWYHEGIDFVLQAKLFNGTSATTFEPNADMTRAMLVTVLWRLDEEPDSTVSDLFADILAGTWYTDAVAWATENDIVDGYDADSFGPGDPVTREQIAVILYRYASYKGYDLTASNDLSAFTDAGNVSAWALPAMKWAVAEELITGISATNLSPGGNASRAQVATILMRFVETIVK